MLPARAQVQSLGLFSGGFNRNQRKDAENAEKRKDYDALRSLRPLRLFDRVRHQSKRRYFQRRRTKDAGNVRLGAPASAGFNASLP